MNTKTMEQMVTKEQKFRALAETWKREAVFLSSAGKKAMHPAYQRIIGMGEVALPLILEELKKDPTDWFWALSAITGESPIPESSAGNIEEMTEAWLRWGHKQGYLK